ncbi:CPBP family intramembrane glutamic endopeptidase [Knoellia sp. LjRoot47]|uniref:CPBP family intramembrane glutamic endopeptidase n=1 Tax=Knoellia sp. LjRoot47 TaxID=3342330 RepID=UPI003F4F9052
MAALGEEVAFRGYLLTRLTELLGRGPAGLGASVVGSSVLFGMLHTEQGLVGVVASAVAGDVYGLW